MAIVRLNKVRYTLKLNNMIPMVASWGGHNKVACGFANGKDHRDDCLFTMKTYTWILFFIGVIAILDAERALNNGHNDDNHPQRYINSSVMVHASAVRNIVWHGNEDPANFASCGTDGCIFIHHPHDPHHPILYCRTRSK